MAVKLKKDYRQFLLEAVLIIFSVLLALFLNEYRTRIKEDQARQHAEENLVQEINRNREIMVEYIPYHQQLLDTIRAVIRSDSLIRAINTPFGPDLSSLAPRGLMQEFPNNAAWETIKTQNLVTGVNYDLIYSLTDVYHQQERTIQILDGIVSLVLSREALNADAAKETLLLLYSQLGELIGRERLLKEKYDEVLRVLEEKEL